jgi:hypothetical protein
MMNFQDARTYLCFNKQVTMLSFTLMIMFLLMLMHQVQLAKMTIEVCQ